jgi:hypothetical protein
MRSKDQILLEQAYLNVVLNENNVDLNTVPSDEEIQSYLNQWVKQWNEWPNSIYKNDPEYAKRFTLESIKDFFNVIVQERDRVNDLRKEDNDNKFAEYTIFDVINGIYSDDYKDKHGIRSTLNPSRGLVDAAVEYISSSYTSEEDLKAKRERNQAQEQEYEFGSKLAEEIKNYIKSNPNNIEGIISIVVNKFGEFFKKYPRGDSHALYDLSSMLESILERNGLDQEDITYILDKLRKMDNLKYMQF